MSELIQRHRVIAYYVSEGKCSGECCRLMTLSASPETVAVYAAGARYLRRHPGAQVLWSPSAEYVEENFVPVRKSYFDGITGRRRYQSAEAPAPETQYRCRKWDGRTKRCTDYGNRPNLCRTFGVDSRCERHDCTLRQVAVTLDHLRWESEGGPELPVLE